MKAVVDIQKTTLQDRLAEWIALVDKKKALEKDVNEIKDRLAAIEPNLLEDFALSGFQSVNVKGFVVYKSREFTCSVKEGVDRKSLVEGLHQAGHDECLMLSYQTVRSLVKEMAEAGEKLPEHLSRLVDVGERFTLRTKKA